MASQIHPFFDPDTNTFTYVVVDEASKHAAIIDPVLDFDPASGRVSSSSAQDIVQLVNHENLVVDYLLETHVHADHLSASHYLKQRVGGQIAIGEKVNLVQETFGPMFNAGPAFATDGRQFDCLLGDGETFSLGELVFTVMHTPGHTPACITYLVDGKAFVGDTLFMPDYGTARADFPGGDASSLFDSIERILSLPEDTEVYLCHDYLPEGRDEYRCSTTVAEQKKNVHLSGKSKPEFIESRRRKDKALAAPRLLLPSIQVNMRAGDFPPAEKNGMHYLKVPLKIELA